MSVSPIRVGMMGFGQAGRQIYQLAALGSDIEIVAIADIGRPDILHYLLCSEVDNADHYQLDGNYLVNPKFKTRMMQIDRPAEMPWDVFGVDMVIDSTGKFRDKADMQDHLSNGAGRVLLRTLPTDYIDRIVIPGINEDSAQSSDTIIKTVSWYENLGHAAQMLDVVRIYSSLDEGATVGSAGTQAGATQ